MLRIRLTALMALTLFLLAGCSGIKITKSMLKMGLASSMKTSTELFYADSCDKRIGVSYVADGDSAGDHIALYMAEGSEDRTLPIHPEIFTVRGVLINCPAYDYATFGNSKSFSKSALEWFIGPRYEDREWMTSMSSRTFFSSYHGPLFVSTCTNDFIRSQSLLIKEDSEALARPLVFVDIASDDKKVGHVHNVTDVDLPESREVNARMIEFLDAWK